MAMTRRVVLLPMASLQPGQCQYYCSREEALLGKCDRIIIINLRICMTKARKYSIIMWMMENANPVFVVLGGVKEISRHSKVCTRHTGTAFYYNWKLK